MGAARPTRTRLLTACAAVMLFGAVGGYAIWRAGVGRELVAIPVALALAAIVLALVFRLEDAVAPALGLAGFAYAGALLLRDGGVDPGAVAVAGTLVLAAELAAWSFDAAGVAAERRATVARALRAAGVAALALVVAAAVGTAALADAGGDPALLLGAAASVGAAVVLALLAWRASRTERPD